MAARGARRGCLTLVGLGLLLGVTAASATPARTNVFGGAWRLETPLGEAAGPFLLVQDHHTGSWRCEIAVAEQGRWPAREDLARRQGRGWTITHRSDGSFVQPWSEPWRELGPEAARACGDLIASWRRGDLSLFSASGHPVRWRPSAAWHPSPVILDDWAGLPEAWRPPARRSADGGALRQRLTARGLGRGGDGLVLDLRWEGEDLVASSARWPGRLVLRRAGASQRAEVPEEAFLPLWPLAEFLP